jgi:hypothetical protein
MNRERDITQDIPLVADPGTRPGSSCPDATLLAAYAETQLETDKRSELEEHLADCSFCLGQIGSLVRDADRELPAVPSSLRDAVQEPRTGWFGWGPKPAWAAVATAAVLILAVGVAFQLDRQSGPSDPVPSTSGSAAQSTYGSPPDRAMRNGTRPSAFGILEPEEGAVLEGPEIELHWQGSPQSLQYSVLLVSLEGDLMWEGRTTGDRISVPASKLATGERYFVWIEAQLRGGGRLKSAPVGFRLAPG